MKPRPTIATITATTIAVARRPGEGEGDPLGVRVTMSGQRSTTGICAASWKVRSRSIIVVPQQLPKSLPPDAEMNGDGSGGRSKDPGDLSGRISRQMEQDERTP